MNFLLLATHIMAHILSMDLLSVESYVGVHLFKLNILWNQVEKSVMQVLQKLSQKLKTCPLEKSF